MLKGLAVTIQGYFLKGHERTLLAKKNIAISFIYKGFNILIGLALIPMTISYVNPTQYGVWLTLSSIISWFSFFDVGLGNGLKNKLAETNALNQQSKSQIYVSTTYAILALITLVVFIIFLISNQFINWSKILNTASTINLNQIALLVIGIFCLQFVFQLLNTVLTACHAPGKVSLITLIGQVFAIIAIYILKKTTTGSLIYLVLVLAGTPLIIQVVANIWYYNFSYKNLMPKINLVNFKYAKDLLGVGGVFFVIQIGALVLFQTDNVVITQLLGPQEVTTFNVAYKYFSVITMVFNIIITPFWSAFTDAYTKGDTEWIKSVLNKMKKFWLALTAVTILLLLLTNYAYKIWLHGSVVVPQSLSVAMALYVITYSWQTIHVFFLNGIGKIRLQLYLVLISSIINIPIAVFLGRKIGLAGVTFSNVFLFMIMGIIFSIQTGKILNGTAKGILNK